VQLLHLLLAPLLGSARAGGEVGRVGIAQLASFSAMAGSSSSEPWAPWRGTPNRVLAATILVSRLGSGVMFQFGMVLSIGWLTISAMKKRSSAICTAMGWMSEPKMHFSIR
jgi:hypothetical protein